MKSDVAVCSKLMRDDEDHRPQYRYIPGDYVRAVYPQLADVRVYESVLTENQITEMRQYLLCVRCGRPCAGTCS